MRDRLIIRTGAPSTLGHADTAGTMSRIKSPVILSEAHLSGVEGSASALMSRATDLPCPILATAFGREGGKPQTSFYLAAIFLCVLFFCLTTIHAFAQAPAPAASVVLDRVVAVVNNQAILSSDIDNEIRLSVLDPVRGGMGVLTPARALDQLIGRALIQQQIRQEDQQAAEPSQAEVNARLGEIRRELPACVRGNCSSDAGWNTFLAAHDLTEEGVDSYLRYRLEILRFIEQRFRQGISISPQEIETYYHDTLLPQYAKGEAIPPLEKVSARIQEILLQQRVNAMFDEWLNNLRKQGDVEVMDPSLESPAAPAPASPASQPAASQDAFPGGNGEGIK
jgi:peptidyl-prolyl cis-trans isomerase SurA